MKGWSQEKKKYCVLMLSYWMKFVWECIGHLAIEGKMKIAIRWF